MTVLAGMLSPMAKVSVAKSALIRPSWNRSSVVSFRIGSRPPWWMPMPRRSSGRTFSTCGRHRSSSERTRIALSNTSSTSRFSSPVFRSSLAICSAYASHSFFEKEKTMTGANCRSMIILTILKQLEPPFAGFFPFRPFFSLLLLVPSSVPAELCSTFMACVKFSSLNSPCSSTTRWMPSPPAGYM